MVPFQLTVLGPPQLRTPAGELVRFRTRKHFALLIYLALEPSIPHRRDRVATMLWPESDIEEARHSLATALSLLRVYLGADVFDTPRDSVRLIAGSVASDAAALGAPETPDTVTMQLGPFLEEFDIDSAPGFQQWKDSKRAQLLPLLHGALTERIDYCRRRGDSLRMEAFALRLLRIDDLSEEATRAQLETRAMAGDRIGALRLYDRWRVRLQEELGALPSSVIARLADRLRRNRWDHANTLEANVRLDQAPEPPFVARSNEFVACYEVWERAREGEPRHLLLRGETGVGKTTLVSRLTTALSLEGATITRVKCYKLETELPFAVIVGVLNQLLDLPGASATAPEHLAELAQVMPKVRQRYAALPDPRPSIPESARMLFTEAALALLAAVADEQPVVLVVDDIHLADVTSLAVLHLMLRRVEHLPLMVVLTSSSALRTEIAEARRFVDSAREIGLTELHLGPLDDDAMRQLLSALTQESPAPAPTVRRALLHGARGNPMVLELLVDDWRRRGDHCVALTLGAMTSTSRGGLGHAFRRVVEDTFNALDPESRAVAELGAILGQRVNDLSMYGLVDMPVARTMRAMTTLTAHRILRDAGNTMEFRSEFVRGQCYLGIAPPLRRMLHGAVADRLVGQDGPADPIPGLEIAWHLVRADRLTEAVPYLLAGGREAIHRAAPHEAELALSTGMPALTGQSRRTAILLLAEARQELGHWTGSLQALEEPSDRFNESEECCRQVFRIIARRWLGELTPVQMKRETARLLDIAARNITLEVRAKAIAGSLRLLLVTRNAEHLDRLEELASQLSALKMDAFDELHVILSHAWIHDVRGRKAEALAEIVRGVALANDASVASSIAVRLLIGHAALLCGLGRYSDALPTLEQATKWAKRLDNQTLIGECLSQLALVHGRLGNAQAQIACARDALGSFSEQEWSGWIIGAAYELGLGLVSEGRFQEAQLATALLSKKRSAALPGWIAQAGFLMGADILAMTGSARRAHTLAGRGTSGKFARLMNIAYAGQFARWVALLAIRDNKLSAARKRLRSAFPTTRDLDLKDQAEVCAALATIESQLGHNNVRAWARLHQQLDVLPVAIGTVLKRLGTYQDGERKESRRQRP
jgi:DNA-binding SARP family transcriptional activator/tetratricopeptide (TPR) repeat protein